MNWCDCTEDLVRRFAGSWSRKFRFSREDSEDFAQEAVVLALVKMREGLICHRQGLWVLVRNLAFDVLRKRRGKDAELTERLLIDFGSENRVLDRLTVEKIGEEFPEFLSWAEARAAGYSWDEIAEAFDVPASSMRVQWGRVGRIVREKYGLD